ncbi:MAG: nuclear transport factor 2 family protein [Candidatus Competibacteraceae bacterium]
MNHLRNLALSLPIALCALLPPTSASAQSYNELREISAAQKAGVNIQALIQPAATSTVLQQAAKSFFAAYQQATLDANATATLLNLLTDNVEMVFSGQPGEMLPFAGTFVGHDGVANVMKAIRDNSKTESFQVRETLFTTFAVDFSLLPQNPLIPQDNRVAAILQEVRTANRLERRTYRLDMVAWLTVENDGKISKVQFLYDSYVPSQAFVGAPKLIVNPDIYPAIAPLRDPNADPVVTLTTVMDFLGRFGADTATPFDCAFSSSKQVMDPNVAISFAGDPKLLPWTSDQIQQGIPSTLNVLCTLISNSLARVFDIEEVAVGADRVIANAFEWRTAVATHRGYDYHGDHGLQILMTARNHLLTSLKSVYDSVSAATAVQGVDPFYVDPFNWRIPAGQR